MFVGAIVFIVLLLPQRRNVESHFLVPQNLIGPDAEEEDKGKDGEKEAVHHAHPQPDPHPQFETSEHLGKKWGSGWENVW